MADQKKDTLQLAHDVNTFHIECQETMVCLGRRSIIYILCISHISQTPIYLMLEFMKRTSSSVYMNYVYRGDDMVHDMQCSLAILINEGVDDSLVVSGYICWFINVCLTDMSRALNYMLTMSVERSGSVSEHMTTPALAF